MRLLLFNWSIIYLLCMELGNNLITSIIGPSQNNYVLDLIQDIKSKTSTEWN